jgi:RNA polymerase sigma-70 factor (ECF subfamily)
LTLLWFGHVSAAISRRLSKSFAFTVTLSFGSLTGSQATEMIAEDLTQEIFLKVFENISSFRYESSFATWLYRIAVNTCMNFQRDKKPAESLGVTDDLGSSVSPEAICEWGELQRKIEAEIASLLSPLKIAFLLVVVEGMTYREASEILGLSVDALRMRVSRARQILREKLKGYMEG